jgi:hypothetical protein
MLFSFAYLAFSAVLRLLVSGRSSEIAKDVELLVLRHQLGVLERQQRRPSLRPADRPSTGATRAKTRARRAHQLHAQQRWGSDVRAGHLPGTRREPGLTTNYTGMPCRVGGAFPSLPTRRIFSSGTVIHESGPESACSRGTPASFTA